MSLSESIVVEKFSNLYILVDVYHRQSCGWAKDFIYGYKLVIVVVSVEMVVFY